MTSSYLEDKFSISKGTHLWVKCLIEFKKLTVEEWQLNELYQTLDVVSDTIQLIRRDKSMHTASSREKEEALQMLDDCFQNVLLSYTRSYHSYMITLASQLMEIEAYVRQPANQIVYDDWSRTAVDKNYIQSCWRDLTAHEVKHDAEKLLYGLTSAFYRLFQVYNISTTQPRNAMLLNLKALDSSDSEEESHSDEEETIQHMESISADHLYLSHISHTEQLTIDHKEEQSNHNYDRLLNAIEKTIQIVTSLSWIGYGAYRTYTKIQDKREIDRRLIGLNYNKTANLSLQHLDLFDSSLSFMDGFAGLYRIYRFIVDVIWSGGLIGAINWFAIRWIVRHLFNFLYKLKVLLSSVAKGSTKDRNTSPPPKQQKQKLRKPVLTRKASNRSKTTVQSDVTQFAAAPKFALSSFQKQPEELQEINMQKLKILLGKSISIIQKHSNYRDQIEQLIKRLNDKQLFIECNLVSLTPKKRSWKKRSSRVEDLPTAQQVTDISQQVHMQFTTVGNQFQSMSQVIEHKFHWV